MVSLMIHPGYEGSDYYRIRLHFLQCHYLYIPNESPNKAFHCLINTVRFITYAS